MTDTNFYEESWYNSDFKKYDQLMKLLGTYHRIDHDGNNYPEKLVWCLKHCQGKFRDSSNSNGTYWYFEKEVDAAMFVLKWT